MITTPAQVHHQIETIEREKSRFCRLYQLPPDEPAAVKEYIDENLAAGKIRHSKSSSSFPMVFAKEKDGSLCEVVDYRSLDQITKRYSTAVL